MKACLLLICFSSFFCSAQLILSDSIDFQINLKTYSHGAASGLVKMEMSAQHLDLELDDEYYEISVDSVSYRKVLSFINEAYLNKCNIPEDPYECNGGSVISLDISQGESHYSWYIDRCGNEDFPKECGSLVEVVYFLHDISLELKDKN